MLSLYLARERLLAGMLEEVDFKRHAAFERLAACLAGERHFLGVS